jgi:hypothetical protein
MKNERIKKANSVIELIDGKANKNTRNFVSLSDCIEGTAVVKAAMGNVEQSLIGSFSTMNEMAGHGLLIRGTDYDTIVDSEGDLVLRFNYKLFYDKAIQEIIVIGG